MNYHRRITLASSLDTVNSQNASDGHPFVEAFGSRLKRARMAQPERAGPALSQEALATSLGVKSLAVGRWESGEREPPLATIRALAEKLGVPAGWLVNGEGGEPDFIQRAKAFLPAPRAAVASSAAIPGKRPRGPAAKRESRVVRDEKGRVKPSTSPRKKRQA